MVLPQYSLRQILAWTALAAGCFSIGYWALQGHGWAIGISLALIALVVILLVHAGLFWLIWSVSRIWERVGRKRAGEAAALTLAVAALTAMAGSALGGTIITLPGQVVTLDKTGAVVPASAAEIAAANASGMTLTVDTTGSDSYGYRPIKLTFIPTAVSTADRVFRVQVQPRSIYRRGQASMTVTRDVEVPAGAASQTVTFFVPQYEAFHAIGLDVWEDGRYLSELSLPSNNFFGLVRALGQGNESTPSVLFLGSPANTSPLWTGQSSNSHTEIRVGPNVMAGSISSMLLGGRPHRQVTAQPTASYSSLGDLPDHWLGYSQYDVVITSYEELTALEKGHPAQWQALVRWVRAGGNLWIHSLGEPQAANPNGPLPPNPSPWKHLPEIQTMLGLPAGPASRTSVFPGWDEPNADLFGNAVVGSNDPAMGSAIPMEPAVEAQGSQSRIPTSTDDPNVGRSPFVTRRLGHGMVALIGWTGPFSPWVTGDKQQYWTWLWNTAGAERWHWNLRHGVSFGQANGNYWNFLVPGVGSAPVTAFQLLITVFVIFIGPVNYLLLKRWHKLNLLLITVPASALLVTGALLAYAIASDGLGVRVRSRSVTYLDARSGEAATLGRIAYYAGLAPREGLRFSGNTAVYPLEEAPPGPYEPAGRSLTVAWDPAPSGSEVGSQHLQSGWLDARTQTQLVTMRAGKSEAKLVFSDGERKVTNRLGARIEKLWVRDSQGVLLGAEGIEAGATGELSVVGLEAWKAEIGGWRKRVDLRPPEGVELTGRSTIFGVRRGRYRYESSTYDQWANASLLERQLASFWQELARPRTFVAITERPPEMDLGLEGGAEVEGLHVIVGEW